jgi:biopolymer transport protein ExbD
MAMSGGRENGEPMMEMNMTPLIDVLLVLLIMFIITIPIQTHAVKVDLPQGPSTPPPVEPTKNTLAIDAAGTTTWNGIPVNDVTLRQYLDQSASMSPEPELHFQPDPQARYEKVDQVMAVIKRSNVSKLGFIGNEQYRNDF